MKITSIKRVVKDYAPALALIASLIAMIHYVPIMAVPAGIALALCTVIVLLIAVVDIGMSISDARDERLFQRKRQHYRTLGTIY